MRNHLTIINVYKKKNPKSEVVTQLLYGDTFKKKQKKGSWIKIKNDFDNYTGFIKNKNYPFNQKNTHKICNLKAHLYSSHSLNSRIQKKLSFGSKIKITRKKINFINLIAIG